MVPAGDRVRGRCAWTGRGRPGCAVRRVLSTSTDAVRVPCAASQGTPPPFGRTRRSRASAAAATCSSPDAQCAWPNCGVRLVGVGAVEIEPQGVVPGLIREQRDDLVVVAPGVLEPLQHQNHGGIASHVARFFQQRARCVHVHRLGRDIDCTDEGRVDLVAS